jgi:hypothetical protein
MSDENYYGFSWVSSGVFNNPGSPSGRSISTLAGNVVDPDPSYLFTRSVDIQNGEYDTECIEDRLKPFRRPTEFQDKAEPEDFRIQDSYIHHKSDWDGWQNMGVGPTEVTEPDGSTTTQEPENQYIDILFLSRAKKSEKKFEKYQNYTPNFNGYYDAQFDRYVAKKDEDLVNEGE